MPRTFQFRIRLLLLASALAGLTWFGLRLYRAGGVSAQSEATPPAFVEFESGQVRPLALSADGNTLFAVNTPNGTLEVFALNSGFPTFQYRVPVGLEPVAVAARTPTEVWVTNLLSDSVSIVSLKGTPHVVQTLLVGDEPRDIVFAGNPQRAFITTAHRGQQRTDPSIANVPGAGDPQLTTAGVPRADVWVFDPANLGATMGGTPLSILSFFTDTPRALAVSPDGNTVYVAGFKTGNQTTTIAQGRVCTGFQPNTPCTLADGSTSPGGNPGPATDATHQPAPEVGLIVQYNNSVGHWEDELHRVWDGSVRFTLPDTDVFAVNANTLAQTAAYAHVGTTLFNMATNPVSGALYVSNTNAFNTVRFEGPGIFGGETVQGHLAEADITVISGGAVSPRHLNKHINYSALAGSPGFDPAAKTHSLSMPTGMAVTADGKTLYVAAFGSSKIGVFTTAGIEQDTFNPVTASANYIPVSAGGVSGVVLDETRGLLYAMTRFDDAVKVVKLSAGAEIGMLPLPNPEPEAVIHGRPFLYDATRFSGNGEAACASCHIFGDKDELAWDLGNPDNAITSSPIPINLGGLFSFLAQVGTTGVSTPVNGSNQLTDFHPMKGPMTTQTLRGLRNSGAMHWRGDRSVGPFGTAAFDANTSFLNFGPAFQALVGSPTQPLPSEMQSFANFQLQVFPPPNPVRNLDNSLTTAQQQGQAFYSGTRPADGVNSPFADALFGQSSFTCNGCHVLDASSGFFGTGGNQSFEQLTQTVKIPQLRNLYDKIGMFGDPSFGFLSAPDSGPMGNQVRGFGFLNDGSVDTVFRFLSAAPFTPTSNSGFPQTNPDGTRHQVEQYLLAFDSDLAPIVGQQVTLTSLNSAGAGPRIDLLIARASTPFTSKALGGAVTECDLVAQVALNGRVMGYLYDPVAGNFVPDDGSARLSDASLRALAATPGQEITYTAATPGSGQRIAFAHHPARFPRAPHQGVGTSGKSR
jgi:DNA-binding beta-propeller fold protein YncE